MTSLTQYLRRNSFFLAIACFASTLNFASANESTLSHCTSVDHSDKKTLTNNIEPPSDGSILLLADQIISNQSNQFSIDGNVTIQTNKQTINADKAQYNHQRSLLSALGNITFLENKLFVRSDKLDINLKTDTGNAKNTQYKLVEQNTNGEAKEIHFRGDEIKLTKSTYSTCEEEEDKRKVWQIRADKIEISPKENEVIARNMQLEIKDVPIIYLPYISLPLKGRKTGFLAPKPSYSSKEGFDLSTPYYFNLKPNMDMTITPRIIENRGAHGSVEFRYLKTNSNGYIGVEALPSDNLNQKDRHHFNFGHQQFINDKNKISLDYVQVSDQNYFSELGTELNIRNTAQLSRQVSTSSYGKNWRLTSLFQDYQMLDLNEEPYRRIPQVDLYLAAGTQPLFWNAHTQYTYFQKNADDYIHRISVQPSLSLPLHTPYAFYTPTIGLYAVAYERQGEDQSSFINWRFTQKAGLYFERHTKTSYQTLTPELEYTYIPHKSQSHLPVVDSYFLNYDMAYLFNDNRYSGNDRLGDENRLSWSISSDYYLNAVNQKLLSAKFAQALFIEGHQEMLIDEKPINKNDVLSSASIESRLSSQLSLEMHAFHFSNEQRLNNGNATVRYKDKTKLYEQAELSYRFRDQSIEQLSFVGMMDISSRWRLATRWLYSLNDQRTREALLGLEYNSCCWTARLMSRQYASQDSDDLNTSIGLQIELKGLTSIGSSLDKQFSNEVFGNQ